MPSIQTASGSMWYADHRDPTIHMPVTVFVHGAGGTHLDWPAELRRLPEANAIVPDLPGHGRSPVPGRQTVSAYAADVIALLDALKLAKVIVAGHSMGGAIAMTMALNYAERVQGLILVGSSAKLGVHPDILNGFMSEMRRTVTQLVELYYGRTGTDSMWRRSTQRLMEYNPTILTQDYAACNLFDLRTQVEFIRQPTLILGGTDDKLTPYKFSEFLHEKISGSQLVKVEGGGHMMMLEQPDFVAEAVRKRLLEQKRQL
jgi:pimeloyl-ACP methyl ester carboxylesterase